MRRVVITGMGIVSSIGNNTQEVLSSLHEAKSGITHAAKYKELGFRSQVAGQSVEIDRGASGVVGVDTTGHERSDHPSQDIAHSAGGHSGVSAGVVADSFAVFGDDSPTSF